MDRLIKDAAKLDKSFKYNTKTVIKNKKAVKEMDYTYADVVKAIHIVQTNMGITGTTAEEAAKTISGSIGMLKAAWANLITGMGEGDEAKLDKLVNDVVDAAKTAASNILPVAEKALYGLAQLVADLAPVIARELPKMVGNILPALLNAVGNLMGAVVRSIPGLIHQIVPTVISAVGSLVESVTRAFPKMLSKLVQYILYVLPSEIAGAISNAMGGGLGMFKDIKFQIRLFLMYVQNVTGRIVDLVSSFWNTLLKPVLDSIIGFVLDTMLPSIGGIMSTVMPLFDAVGDMLTKHWQFLTGVWEGTVMPIIRDAWRFITETLLPSVTAMLTDKVLPAIDNVFNIAVYLWNDILQPVVMTIWETIVNVVGPAIINTIQFLLDHMDMILPVISGVMAGIAAFMIIEKINGLSSAVQNVTGIVKGFFEVVTKHPFAIVIGAIVALVSYLVYLYNTNEEARDKINAAFEAIKGFWENTLKPAFEAIYNYVVKDLIPTLIVWWDEKLKPTIQNVFEAIKGFWENTLRPAFENIRDFVVNTLIPKFKEFGEYVGGKFLTAFKTVKQFWQDSLEPRINALKEALEKFYTNVIKPVAVYISDTFLSAWKKITDFFNDVVSGAISGIADVLGRLYNTYLKPVAEWITNNFVIAWDTLKGAMNGMITFITGIFSGNWRQAWNVLVNAVGGIFDGLKDILKRPINAVIDMLNKMIGKVESAINKVINGINRHLRIDIDFGRNPFTGRSLGGIHWGANLSTVSWDRIQRLWKGGTLGEGEMAMVGEYAPEMLRVVNGRAIVTPLSDKPGRLGTNNNININVYPQPGQSPEEIAEQVNRVLKRELTQKQVAFV